MEAEFLLEILYRTCIMFLVILLVLRLSGRRGVRQLTLFEVAIILGMGSAAGDPMFQEDLPLLYGITVLFTIVLLYKGITLLSARWKSLHEILEGKSMVIVEEGVFDIKHEKDSDFSQMEFFAELRNQSVEHLGQVRFALLETDATLSILYYPDEEVKYGLPLFPDKYKSLKTLPNNKPCACMFCGKIEEQLSTVDMMCPRCKHQEWTLALKTKRIS
jgi:uncharacterized membrane protein YcaP (DUF421 family)